MKRFFCLLLLYLLLAPHPSAAWAWGYPFTLTNVSGTVTYPSPASHTVAFTISSPQMTKEIQVRYCTTAWGNCTKPTGLNVNSVGEGTVSGLTAANWIQSGSDNLIKYENDSGEVPNTNVSIEFTNITNPTIEGTFWFRISLFSDAEATNEIEDGITASAKLGITVSAIVNAAVKFMGYGHPGDLVTIKEGGATIGTTEILSDGTFEKQLDGQAPGLHTYTLRAQDVTSARYTSPETIFTNLENGYLFVFSNIVFSPTIGLSKSSYKQGEGIKTLGSTHPTSTVDVYYASPLHKWVTSTGTGAWSYTLTEKLSVGAHQTYCHVTVGSYTSDLSEIVPFTVTAACLGDFNNDGWVNLTDFSILLYYWGKHDTTHDLSGDGYINLTDFSIMLFYWGKC